MFNLNELCVIAYENAAKREAKDGKVSTDTRLMLKHTATEVVEAAEAYNSMVDGVANKEIFASELADIVCCVLLFAVQTLLPPYSAEMVMVTSLWLSISRISSADRSVILPSRV